MRLYELGPARLEKSDVGLAPWRERLRAVIFIPDELSMLCMFEGHRNDGEVGMSTKVVDGRKE